MPPPGPAAGPGPRATRWPRPTASTRTAKPSAPTCATGSAGTTAKRRWTRSLRPSRTWSASSRTRPACSSSPAPRSRTSTASTPGAGTGHRSVGPSRSTPGSIEPELRAKMRHQLYETSFLGMGIMAGPDLAKFLSASQGNLKGLFHAAWRFGLHVLDLLVHRRNMQLVNGTALTGRLMKSADDLGVDIRVSTPARRCSPTRRPGHRRRRRSPEGELHDQRHPRRRAGRRRLPERRRAPHGTVPEDPDRTRALDAGAEGNHRRRHHPGPVRGWPVSRPT